MAAEASQVNPSYVDLRVNVVPYVPGQTNVQSPSTRELTSFHASINSHKSQLNDALPAGCKISRIEPSQFRKFESDLHSPETSKFLCKLQGFSCIAIRIQANSARVLDELRDSASKKSGNFYAVIAKFRPNNQIQFEVAFERKQFLEAQQLNLQNTPQVQEEAVRPNEVEAKKPNAKLSSAISTKSTSGEIGPREKLAVSSTAQKKPCISQAEYLKLPDQAKSEFTVFEFRLFIADIVGSFMESLKSAVKPEHIADFMKAVKECVYSAREIKVSLVLFDKEANKNAMTADKKITGAELYTLPTWKVFILSSMVGSVTYFYRVNCSERLDIAQYPTVIALTKQYGHAVSDRITCCFSCIDTVIAAINRCTQKKNTATTNREIIEETHRHLEMDRKVYFDAFLETDIFRTVEKATRFWKIFAFHTVALANSRSSSSLIVGTVASDIVDQLCINMLQKWLIEVSKEEKVKQQLVTFAKEFAETAYCLLVPPYDMQSSLTHYGELFLCRVALTIQEKFDPGNKNFWKPLVAELFMIFLNSQSKLSKDRKCFQFLDRIPGSFLCLCFGAKWLGKGSRHKKFVQIITSCGIFEKGRLTKSEFVKAIIQIELHKSLDAESLLATASVGFNDDGENSELKDLLKAVQEHRGTEECTSALQSEPLCDTCFAIWAKNFLSISILTSQMESLQRGENKPLNEVYELAKKLKDQSILGEDEISAIRRAVLQYISDNPSKNLQSISEKESLLGILNLEGYLDPEYATELLFTALDSDKNWAQEVLCGEPFFATILPQMRLVSSDNEDKIREIFDKIIARYDKVSSETLCKFAEKTLEACRSTDWFLQVALESTQAMLTKSVISVEFIRFNVADVTTSEVADMFFESLEQRLSNDSDKAKILRFFKSDEVRELIEKFQSRPFFKILFKALESLVLDVKKDQQSPCSMLSEMLPMKHVWGWLLNKNCPEDLKSSARDNSKATIEGIVDLNNRIRDQNFSLKEFHELECVFDRLEGDAYGLLDDLICAFGRNVDVKTADSIKRARGTVDSWNANLNEVEILLHFLSQISESNSGLNITVIDVEPRKRKFEELRDNCDDKLCAMEKEAPFTRVFCVRSIENMVRAKTLIQSCIFRSTFLEANAGLSSAKEAPLKHMSLSCTEILEKHLPQAVKSYAKFWTLLYHRNSKVEQIERHIQEGEIDFELEIQTAEKFLSTNSGPPLRSKLEILRSVKERSDWTRCLETLHFFAHKFLEKDTTTKLNKRTDGCEFCRTVSRPQRDKESNAMVIFLQQKDPTLGDYTELFYNDLATIRNINPNIWRILEKLKDCKDVVQFLYEQKNSDLQQLLDNTDDSATNDMSPSVINSLISLQNALKHFLLNLTNLPCAARSLLESLEQSITYHSSSSEEPRLDSCAKTLIDRIDECQSNINSIKKLHASLGSRGTTSKKLAKEFAEQVDTAEFGIEIDDCGNVKCWFVHSDNMDLTLTELIEHRSRILLSKNTHQNSGNSNLENDALQSFVTLIDLLESALETLQRLVQSGHPLFEEVTIRKKTSQLAEYGTLLNSTESSWETLLSSLRDEHPIANYVLGPSLVQLLLYFFSHHDIQRVKSILYYMRIDKNSIQSISLGKNTEYDRLRGLGSLDDQNACLTGMLKQMFLELEKMKKIKPRNLEHLSNLGNKDMCIPAGKLVIYKMQPSDKDLLSTFLHVCISSQKEAPWISEIVFCSQQTTSEEVVLAVKRAPEIPERAIFILDAQNLKQNVLYALVSELSEQTFCKNKGRVSIFCRAADSHLLFTAFGNCVVKPIAPANEKLNRLVKECFNDVFFCSSDRPSVGKSEKIVAHLFRSQDRQVQIHVSGSIDKDALIKKLISIGAMDSSVIHFDIGVIQNPEYLEAILFEMSLCNAISTPQCVVAFRPRKIYLEIANTSSDELFDGFSIFSRLSDSKCAWENVQNIVVSIEPMSHIQVVCKYLKLANENKIDVLEISPVEVITRQKCVKLLIDFFSRPLDDGTKPIDFVSFLGLEICIRILGEQLKRFTSSPYFSLRGIRLIGKTGMRSKMVNLIMQSTLQLSLKSVSSIRAQQTESRERGNEREKSSLAGLICWEQFAYVFPVFMNQDTSTVELIFQNHSDVKPEIMELFESASSKQLVEFKHMAETTLQEKLVRIVADLPRAGTHDTRSMPKSYVLTADNFLKMILINLRLDADVPVVLIGETGCGKTSLVRYLAAAKNCQLRVMNFHAGITEAEVNEFISKAEKVAYSLTKQFAESLNREGTVLVFLDEVNTCEHLGLLKEVVCHKKLQSRQLPSNLRFIVACNPYILRKCTVQSAGFEIRELDDKMAGLVYRVNPLPESMLELVWDFGRLTENDELVYIRRMIGELFSKASKAQIDNIVASLSEAQKFIRSLDDVEFTVSLRDIRRFCEFFNFFTNYFSRKELIDKASQQSYGSTQRAWLFGLYICYYVRLMDSTMRKRFLSILEQYTELTTKEMIEIFEKEELDLLNRMTIPSKTAKNLALRENVFVIFSCIYCQIPVFLIGKPGCSKSLAMNIVRSNLRGEDSVNKLLQQFPPLRFFSYQGSETSTSDGIIKVFKKAEKSKMEGKSKFNPVVLIDEIGLAEKSRFNPLKVLHGLLEPESSLNCRSKVSVVGVSNWALDPAKMNRAIYISRPEMNEEELFSTGQAICSESSKKTLKSIDDKVLRKIATASYRHFKDQSPENFHGLRDYYYLLKYICDKVQNSKAVPDAIQEGILRNFNGHSFLLKSVLKEFAAVFPEWKSVNNRSSSKTESKMEQLISQNLSDPKARHLMLVCDGEFCLDLLCKILRHSKRNFRIIHGSLYERDQFSDEFSCRKLNEVMSCMEEGTTLILKDFDLIYGSLYDMLNQNYSEYAGRKYCRVAMGIQANQNCAVHENFRCIVLVEKARVSQLDPPFLNRFEKQLLCFQEKLKSMDLIDTKEKIENLLQSFCVVSTPSLSLKVKLVDTIQGFDKHLVPSYLFESLRNSSSHRSKAERDIIYLMSKHMFPDAVLRVSYTEQGETAQNQEFQQHYFSHCLFKDLDEALRMAMKEVSEPVKRLYIYTRFSLYRSIQKLHDFENFEVTEQRLIDFRQESDLLGSLKTFLKRDKDGILLIRTKPSLDARHILHARCLIDGLCDGHDFQIRSEKVIVFIVHLQQEDLESGVCSSWKWNPLMSSWSLYCVEELNWNATLDLKSLVDLTDSSKILDPNETFLQLVHREAVPKSLSEALRSSDLYQRVSDALRDDSSLKSTLISFITNKYIKPALSEKSIFSQENWINRQSLETVQLANFASFSDFVVQKLKLKYRYNLTEILKLMEEFGLLAFIESPSDITIKALPLVLEKILSDPHFERISRVQCIRKLTYPISPFLFDFACQIFQNKSDDRESFLKEFSSILGRVFTTEAMSPDSDVYKDFICLLSYHFCSVDRTDSLLKIMSKQIDQCNSIDEAVFTIFSVSRKYQESFSDLINVNHHVQTIAAEQASEIALQVSSSIHADLESSDASNDCVLEALNSMLCLLIPEKATYSHLQITSISDWLRVTTSCLGTLRSRTNNALSCVPQLEALFRFFSMFACSENDKAIWQEIERSEIELPDAMNKSTPAELLRLWRGISTSALRNSGDENKAYLSMEVSFYHSLLSMESIDEALLEEIIRKISKGCLPMCFVAIPWEKMIQSRKDLLELFENIVESAPKKTINGIKFTLLESFPDSQTDETARDIIDFMDDISPKIDCLAKMDFEELIGMKDTLKLFQLSVQKSSLLFNDFDCFGVNQEEILIRLNKLARANSRHPVWIAFLRTLRTRYTLEEVERILKFDSVVSNLNCLRRDLILSFGQEAVFIANYSLRYPFVVWIDAEFCCNVINCLTHAVENSDNRGVRHLVQKISEERSEAQMCLRTAEFMGAYVELVGLLRTNRNLRSSEKNLTSEIEYCFQVNLKPLRSHIIRLLCGNRDSLVQCLNSTPQSTSENVCLITLYQTCLLQLLASNVPFCEGSVIDRINRMLLECDDGFEKIFDLCENERNVAMVRRCSLCNCVCVFQSCPDDISLTYPCQYCDSDWTSDLREEIIDLPNKCLTQNLHSILKFLSCLFATALIDSENPGSVKAGIASSFNLEKQFDSLRKCLSLSWEETTWLMHAILTGESDSERPFFNQSPELLLKLVSTYVMQRRASVQKFKRKRLDERASKFDEQSKNSFAYARLIDSIDESEFGEETSTLLPPTGVSEVMLLFDCEILSAQPDQQPHCLGWRRLAGLLLENATVFDRMLHASHLIRYHQLLIASLDIVHSVTVKEIIKNVEEKRKLLNAAQAAWNVLSCDESNALCPYTIDQRASLGLLTESSEALRLVQAAVKDVNRVLTAAALLRLRDGIPVELAVSDGGLQVACMMGEANVITRPDDIPACSQEELNDLTRLACQRVSPAFDTETDWDLLTSLISRKLFAAGRAHFGRADPWVPTMEPSSGIESASSGSLDEATIDDLATNFKAVVTPALLTEANVAEFERNCREDAGHASRVVELCCTALRFVRRRLEISAGESTENLGLAEYLSCIGVVSTEILADVKLNQTLSLLEEAEQTIFAQSRVKIREALVSNSPSSYSPFASSDSNDSTAAVNKAQRLLNGLPEDQLPTVLRNLRSACVRRLLQGGSRQQKQGKPLHLPARLKRLEAGPTSEAGVELSDLELFELSDLMHQQEAAKTSRKKKYSKLLSRY